MSEVVTDEDVRELIRNLLQRAKNGDTVAAKELLDRVAGKSATYDALTLELRGEEFAAKQREQESLDPFERLCRDFGVRRTDEEVGSDG
ncbi:MAG: hypothetical protein JSV19_00220 [Phycisphaerales bacterium]|nr:MAG: hypothetical protein JSV19_00220 [Phycisphaerales bacterium]